MTRACIRSQLARYQKTRPVFTTAPYCCPDVKWQIMLENVFVVLYGERNLIELTSLS